MLDACAFYTWLTMTWYMPRILREDHNGGVSTVRQRTLLRFEQLVLSVQEKGQLPAIGDTTRDVLDALRGRWPTVEPIPTYPAL